jgi:uncharacterized Zn-binding protein involved in type VI secretion
MPAKARLGDTSSHGGTIVSASSDTFVNGIAVARQGDLHSCPLRGHGITPLNSTSRVLVNGRPVVRVGDTAGCGAIVTVGSPNVNAG